MIFEDRIGKVVTVYNSQIAVKLLRDKRYTGCYIGVKVDRNKPDRIVWLFYCSEKFVIGFNEIVEKRREKRLKREISKNVESMEIEREGRININEKS